MWTENFQIFKLNLEKAEEPEIKLRTSLDHQKRKRILDNHLLCFTDYAKAFDCVDHRKEWEILKEMGMSDHLTCLLRNLYAGQEATVRTGRGTTDWFQIGKGVRQGCILLPCLFNLYAGYFTWKVRLDEAQAGIKMAGKNINNLRYADTHPYERLWLNEKRHRDSWPPEEKNSIRGQRWGLMAQSFCVVKFSSSIKEIEKASDIGIRRGQKSTPLLVFSWMLYSH